MIIVIYFFLLILTIGFYTIAPTGMDKTSISVLLLVVLFCIVLFVIKKEKNINLQRQYLRHSYLALIGILIVYFQYPLDYVLGNVDSSNMVIWVNHSIVIKSITLSVIGLICFLLGYFLKQRKKNNKKIKQETEILNTNGLILVAVISLMVFFLTVNPLYLLGSGFGEVDLGANATYAILFFKITIFATVILKVRNIVYSGSLPKSIIEYLKNLGGTLNLLIVVYMVTFLVAGDRGELIVMGLLVFSGYYMATKVRLKLKKLVLYFFIGAFTVTLLGQSRVSEGASFFERLSQGFQNTDERRAVSISPPTAELSWSIRTLNTVVDYVPENNDFFYGRFQSQQITRIIPGFSIFYPLIFDSATYSRYEGKEGNRFESSGNYITWIRQGDYPRFGDGSSVMADFYLDFGLLGVILGMFLFGYLMRYCELNMFRIGMPTLFVHILSVVYFCNTIFIARGTLLAGLRLVFWIYFILIVNRYLLQNILKIKIK